MAKNYFLSNEDNRGRVKGDCCFMVHQKSAVLNFLSIFIYSFGTICLGSVLDFVEFAFFFFF
jgi:hypothetical protein